MFIFSIIHTHFYKCKTKGLREALDVSEKQRIAAEEGRKELMTHLESVFGKQQNELQSSVQELKTALLSRDLAKRENEQLSQSLEAARALARELRMRLKEAESSQERMRGT